jgi:hypothetical protein
MLLVMSFRGTFSLFHHVNIIAKVVYVINLQCIFDILQHSWAFKTASFFPVSTLVGLFTCDGWLHELHYCHFLQDSRTNNMNGAITCRTWCSCRLFHRWHWSDWSIHSWINSRPRPNDPCLQWALCCFFVKCSRISRWLGELGGKNHEWSWW